MLYHNHDGVVRSVRRAVHGRVAPRSSAPVSIEQLLRDQHIRVIEEWQTPGRFEALSIFKPSQQIVVVNRRLSPMARRFALAHELAHGWFHRRHLSGVHQAGDYVRHPYYALLEREANAAAAEILLPYDWFMATAHQLLPHQPLTLAEFKAFMASAAAHEWARTAEVSLPVLGYHLIDCEWAPPTPRSQVPPWASESAPPTPL